MHPCPPPLQMHTMLAMAPLGTTTTRFPATDCSELNTDALTPVLTFKVRLESLATREAVSTLLSVRDVVAYWVGKGREEGTMHK